MADLAQAKGLHGQQAVILGGPDWLVHPVLDHLANLGLDVTFIGALSPSIPRVRVLSWDSRSAEHLSRILTDLDRQEAAFLVHIQTPSAPVPFLSISSPDWNLAANENLTSAYLLCHYLLPPMIERGFGRIAFISSLIGRTGAPLRSRDASFEAGILGFCRTLALEVAASGITANVISVPDLDSRASAAQSPLLRPVRAGDVLDAYDFVASEGSSFVTGQEIRVSGGQHLW